jgi:mannose-1-phosphate guanylyltransferase
MAAAAVFVAEQDPDAVLVVLSADHHIPDVERFSADIAIAATGARDGYIVVLGVPPTEASTAFGYIRSDAALGNPRPIERFVEKPGAALAQRYVDEGYLWNSGMFVVSARTLLTELTAHAPEVLAEVRGAVAAGVTGA